jgi:hypothetical protein
VSKEGSHVRRDVRSYHLEQTSRYDLRDCRFERVQLLACCVSLVILAAAANLVTLEEEGGLAEDWTKNCTQARQDGEKFKERKQR